MEETSSQEQTAKASFTAYAVIDDNDKFNHEAMSKALQALLEHSAAQDIKLAEMTLQLQLLSNDALSDSKVASAFDVKPSIKKPSPKK